MKKYFLTGIGGSGMSALAQVLVNRGASVSGSDRSYDRKENAGLFKKLIGLGIKLYAQDGTGVTNNVDKIIMSRAVEEDNQDLVKARNLKIPVLYRQDVLKEIFRDDSGIAVSGTSGKTTVVGMISCILPNVNVINGGIIKNYETKDLVGNVRFGKSSSFCIETDESEGNLKGYFPKVGVITNIGKDHMDGAETDRVYKEFCEEVQDVLIVRDDVRVKHTNKMIFSIKDAKNVRLFSTYSLFKFDGKKYRLNVPGMHNIYNALAAIKVSYACGVSVGRIAEGLDNFKGIKRRFELVSDKNGIRVIDDFAHNSDKICAALETAHLGGGRVIAVYQPHGYGPLRMFLKELARVFLKGLSEEDYLFIPDVYYAGGAVNKDVTSKDLVEKINKSNVKYVPDRKDIKVEIVKMAKKGDTVLVMGARDVTLSCWAKEILKD